MTAFEYYHLNQDRIHDAFDEHISNMLDDGAHIRRLSESDAYFWEYVENMMDSENISIDEQTKIC